MSFAMAGPKTYCFTVAWGEARDTDDREGTVTATSDVRPNAAQIKKALKQFGGTISQIPPVFSALKVGGRRAYDLARKGDKPVLGARDVIVHRIELLAARANDADFEVECGKGTYVRALGRDIAVALGTCGHISALRRTRVGPFVEADAFSLDMLEQLSHIAPPERYLRPIETPLDDIPEVAVMESEADRLRQGQAVSVPHRLVGEVLITTSKGVLKNKKRGTAIGLGVIKDGKLRPKRVFNL
jgi:tRNA pseudouridine55 synthase